MQKSQYESGSSHENSNHSREIEASLVAQTVKNLLQCRRRVFHSWVRKIPWRRKWQPTPVFLPENPMDRGAWWATVHGVTKSQTQLSMHTCTRVAELKNWIYGHWIAIKTNSESEVTQSCPTLCDPSIYGVFQARVLEWGTISFSRRSSRPRDWTQVSCIAGRHFTIWATREIRNACWRRLLRVPWTARKSNQSILKIILGVHLKDWCWSWNSNTLATSCEKLTHWKRPWCWEGLGEGGEGDDRGWDGWMASPTRWTWVWVNSGTWWWTGRPGVLQSMGSRKVRQDWVTELNWILILKEQEVIIFSTAEGKQGVVLLILEPDC